MPEDHAMRQRIKEVLIESLNLEGMTPEMIGDEQPLFGEGLGLDSIDALELVVGLEQEFGIRIEGQEIDAEAFSTIARLERMVRELRDEKA